MPSNTKAVLLNLGVFTADNNLRRNVSTLAYNFTSPTASVMTNNFTLFPGESSTLNTPMSISALTLLTTTSELTVNIIPRTGTPYTLTVAKLHLVDSDIAQVVLTNPSSTESARVTVIQC